MAAGSMREARGKQAAGSAREAREAREASHKSLIFLAGSCGKREAGSKMREAREAPSKSLILHAGNMREGVPSKEGGNRFPRFPLPKLVKLPAGEPIARLRDWALYRIDEKSSSDWTNLKLIRTGRQPKNAWRLAWNGERMADTRDLRLLTEHNPDAARWVVAVMEDRSHD